MEAEKIIKEKEIVHEDEHKDYASKGVGNAGLTLGIIGTALGAWAVSRNRGGLFGGGWGAGMPENVNINTDHRRRWWFRVALRLRSWLGKRAVRRRYRLQTQCGD